MAEPLAQFTVLDGARIAKVVRRAERSRQRGLTLQPRHRAVAPDAYSDFSVYVTLHPTSPGLPGGLTATDPATFAYVCTFLDGAPIFARVDPEGNYLKTALRRDTADFPMQPDMRRWPGFAMLPAPDDPNPGSLGTGVFNQNGDFVLKHVEEIPVSKEACT